MSKSRAPFPIADLAFAASFLDAMPDLASEDPEAFAAALRHLREADAGPDMMSVRWRAPIPVDEVPATLRDLADEQARRGAAKLAEMAEPVARALAEGGTFRCLIETDGTAAWIETPAGRISFTAGPPVLSLLWIGDNLRRIGPRLLEAKYLERPPVENLVERNRALAAANISAAPSVAAAMFSAARNTGEDAERYLELVRSLATHESEEEPLGIGRKRTTARRISVALSPLSRRQAVTEDPTGNQLILEYGEAHEVETGTPEQFLELTLRCLRAFNTSALATCLAMFSVAWRNDGMVPLIATRIARERGVERPGTSFRKRIAEHLELLMQVKLDVQWPGGKRWRPWLFMDGGEISAPRIGTAPYVVVEPRLWSSMREQGHALLWDRRILAADARADEWPIRIYLAIADRWSVGWVRHRYDRTGGEMKYRVGTLLERAGLQYRDQLARRGGPWLREQVRTALEALERWPVADAHGRSLPLIGRWSIEERETPEDDLVKVAATDELAAELTRYRAPGIRNRDRAEERRALAAEGGPTVETTRPRRGSRKGRGKR